MKERPPGVEKKAAGRPRGEVLLYVVTAILTGFAGSLVAGMFGIGGASVTTPALRLALGASPAIALGTTLPVIIPTALSGALTYLRRGRLDVRASLLCCASGLAGSGVGALLTRWMDLHYLMLVTGAVVLYFASLTVYRGLTGKIEGEEVKGGPSAERRASGDSPAWLILSIGLAAGVFSGLLGLGGGTIMIPAFMYLLGMPIRKAFGTSLAAIALIAVPGTLIHALLGHVSWTLVLLLSIGSVPGAYLGARLALKTKEPILYVMFGLLFALFGVSFIVNEIIGMLG